MEDKWIGPPNKETFRQSNKVALLVSLGLFFCSINVGMSSFLMPIMATHLQERWPNIACSLAVYFIIIAAFLNFFRQTAIRYGGIRVLRWGFILFALGSILSAFTVSWLDLLFYRLIQALGAACLQATVFGLFADYIPSAAYPVAVHRSSFMLFFGLVLGFLIGGLANYLLDWRFGFILLGASSFVFYFLTLPIKRSEEGENQRYDFMGILLFLIIASTFMVGFAFLAHPSLYHKHAHGIFLLTIFALIVFFFYESRRYDPFMNLGFYRNSGFSLIMFAKLVHSLVTTLFFILGPVYLYYVRHFGFLTILWVSIMPPLGVTAASIIDAFLKKESKGLFFLLMSIVFFTLPLLYICLVPASFVNLYSALAIFVFGIGSGFLQQYLLRITFDVLPESAPRVSTSFRVIHNIGCALAVIIAIFFLVKYWLAQWDDLNAGLAYAFYTGLVLTALVLVFASLRAVTGWVSKLKHR